MMISPKDKRIDYMGRVDFTDVEKPQLIFAGTTVTVRFRGTGLSVRMINRHLWNMNLLGVKLDDYPFVRLPISDDDQEHEYVLAQNLPDAEHTLSMVKVQDSPHVIVLCGLVLPDSAELLPAPEKPKRRMEFYGDSVTCGCCADAFGYEGHTDPEHHGEYCNAYDSYAMMTARNLNAQVNLTSQGGVALFSGTGWYGLPGDTMGMEDMYDKLCYLKEFGITPWDFSRYTPHVVVIAIGQNDAHHDGHPDIEPDKDPAYRLKWEQHYEQLVRHLMGCYPKATFVLATTILRHSKVWDDMIDTACGRIGEKRVKHFLYSNNGDGTDGHIRASEAFHMAKELSQYIEGLGEAVWED